MSLEVMRFHLRLAFLIAFITVALSGCIVFLSSKATLVGPLRLRNGEYLIRVEEVRGPMTFHGHGGVFARTIYVHTIELLFPPDDEVTTYAANQLKIEEMDSEGKMQKPGLVSGTVKIDKLARSVAVDVTSNYGPFSGNGEYPLKVQ